MKAEDRAQLERCVAVDMARADLYFFARWMFLQRKGVKWERSDHHRKICDALMRVYRGECKRLIINVPPRHSKTELAVINFIAWAVGHVPDSEFIHASYGATLAEGNSSTVLAMLGHPAYREVFPKAGLGRTRQNHWETSAGGVMYSVGAGGAVTGFGAGKMRAGFSGALIIDDPHKASEARSDVIRQGVIDWFQNTVESRLNSRETPIVIIMQRLHQKDLAGWLLDGGNGETWEHLCLPVWTDDRQPLWPFKHTAEDLRRMEQAAPYTFAGQYRQQPAPPGGGLFKVGMIEVVDAIPAGPVKWVRGWDLASSTDGDYTAGAKIGRLSDGRFIVADVRRLRAAPDERDASIVNAAKADGQDAAQDLPQDPGQAGKTQALYLARALSGFRVHTSPETGDKITRAEPFSAQVNVGNVLMLRGPWNAAYLSELEVFPNGEFDDQVDASSRAFARFVNRRVGIYV